MRKTEEEKKIFNDLKRQSLVWTNETAYDLLVKGEAKIALVGLGYVGLPIALEFAKEMNVIGFDINADRVEKMRRGEDPSNEIDAAAFENKKITFTSNPTHMESAKVYIVAVPTPVDDSNAPCLKALKAATAAVANCLVPGDYVVYESTVYPGCTEEVCLPILEKLSGLEVNKDFRLGYSPERINPGDKKNTLTTIKKIVAGSDEATCDEISKIYSHVITAGVHKAPSIQVAEAAKIVENTQRDVNIALMNELSILFDKMNIDTQEVLKAAGTKWNFLDFKPGLVGGHCIGVDPYYLIHKARKLKVDADVMKSCRMINDWMPFEILHRVYDQLKERGKVMDGAKVLVMGCTFKENVSDIRNSKAAELANIFRMKHADVDVVDPYAEASDLKDQYDLDLVTDMREDYDVVVMAVSHWEYRGWKTADLQKRFTADPIVFDVKGIIDNDGSMCVMKL